MPEHDKNLQYHMCAQPREDLDQPFSLGPLWKSKNPWLPRAVGEDLSDCADTQADLSFPCVHMYFGRLHHAPAHLENFKMSMYVCMYVCMYV